jgi:hypothetical protein
VEIRQRENLNIIEGGEMRLRQRQGKDKRAKETAGSKTKARCVL